MRAKSGAIYLFLLVFSALLITTVAHASFAPMLVANIFFEEINTNDVDNALGMFAKDAVIINNLTNFSYKGEEEISELLNIWMDEDRQYEVVSSRVEGNTVHFTIEISDHGVVWARQWLTAEFSEGLIKKLELHDIRLIYWPKN